MATYFNEVVRSFNEPTINVKNGTWWIKTDIEYGTRVYFNEIEISENEPTTNLKSGKIWIQTDSIGVDIGSWIYLMPGDSEVWLYVNGWIPIISEKVGVGWAPLTGV